MIDRRALLFVAGSLAAAVALSASAAPSAAASDVSQTRNVPKFNAIRLTGVFTTSIVVGAVASRVVIAGSPDAVAAVTTDVDDGTLTVGMKPGMNVFRSSPKLTITVPALTDVENQGAGSVKIIGLTGGSVDITNSGAASIVASGRAKSLDVKLNGTGRIDTTAVYAGDVDVENNGVGSVRVRASGKLTMTVNGVGEIRYTGSPVSVDSKVNGVGQIRKL